MATSLTTAAIAALPKTQNQQNQFNDFNLPIDGYTAFDALSLKSLIINRLNANNIITDQNYEGSNMSSIIDIIAYAYHVLLFYLNRTGAESTFTTAELYENINKIVKLIGYKPIGAQTSVLPFQASANANLASGLYTLPRYSYVIVNGTSFTFNSDITFAKNTNAIEELTDLENNAILYQGKYTEYPIYNATGAPFEVLTLTSVNPNNVNSIIDHFTIDVYVKNNTLTTPAWVKWTPVSSLFLEHSNSTSYEIRLNENGRYEIKFGNDITGQQLNPGDQVAVYYITSNGASGQVGANLLNGSKIFLYSTSQFKQIQSDTTPANFNLLTAPQLANITLSNIDPSTPFTDVESVDNIRIGASSTFKSQYRLVTAGDYQSFVSSNYKNIISSCRVVNNWDYIQGHLKYYFDLGVTKPSTESRILFNQVKFADSTNFNNIYIYAVPNLNKTSTLTSRINYLNSTQKQLITNDILNTQLITTEPIINDPVYMQVDLGVNIPDQTVTPDISLYTKIVITRSTTAKQNSNTIALQVANIFTNYFATTNDNLGMLLSINTLTNQILQLGDILNVQTVTQLPDGSVYTVPGINLILFNPVYPYNDISIISQDIQLPYFKFPYLNEAAQFIKKISVVTPTIQSLITS
jgi:hypothetical protein